MANPPTCASGNTTPTTPGTHDAKERPENTDNDIRNVKIFPFWLHYANVCIPEKPLGSNTPASKDVAVAYNKPVKAHLCWDMC